MKPARTGRLALGAVAAAVLVAACTNGGGAGSGVPLVACQRAVKASLNNPATADFKTFSTTIEDAFIDGLLTAENAFGVERELQFHCKMDGETVTSVEVLPAA